MTDFGVVVFDIDLKPGPNVAPQEAILLSSLYGPYASRREAEDRLAFIEDEHRERFSNRFGDGRYEFKLEVIQMQTTPLLKEGWL